MDKHYYRIIQFRSSLPENIIELGDPSSIFRVRTIPTESSQPSPPISTYGSLSPERLAEIFKKHFGYSQMRLGMSCWLISAGAPPLKSVSWYSGPGSVTDCELQIFSGEAIFIQPLRPL